MKATLTVGRLGGVPIGAHWSWLIIVGLITFSLAAEAFPTAVPGYSDATYAAMGAVASVLFFGSLLLHELGHAVRARREGMEIEGITLWLFGGVAQFKGAFPSAGAEFRIAIAGPLVTLAIGTALVAATALPLPEPVEGVTGWLGFINFFLLVFNMLPALPLDGGRVLRSALWQRKGDFAAATRSAVQTSQAISTVLIWGGITLFLVTGAFGGAWLALIGWFLATAAAGESRMVAIEQALKGLRVRDVMVARPDTVPAAMTIADFIDRAFLKTRHSVYPVADNGSIVGLISYRDAAAAQRDRWSELRVSDAMVPLERVAVVAAGDELSDVFGTLLQADLKRALVRDSDGAPGLLSVTDVTRVIEVRELGDGASI
jgi:Zn-dependent protease/CBS domain-containing protein